MKILWYAAAGAALLSSAPLRAQLPIPSAAIVAGVSHYRLASNGQTAFGALRLDVPLPLLPLLAEGSVGVMRPSESTGSHTYVIPEAQLQYQLLPVLVRPYLGVGGGWFKNVGGASDLTLSASAGVRATVPLIGVGARAEVRVRGIGSGLGRGAAELTLGVSW